MTKTSPQHLICACEPTVTRQGQQQQKKEKKTTAGGELKGESAAQRQRGLARTIKPSLINGNEQPTASNKVMGTGAFPHFFFSSSSLLTSIPLAPSFSTYFFFLPVSRATRRRRQQTRPFLLLRATPGDRKSSQTARPERQ